MRRKNSNIANFFYRHFLQANLVENKSLPVVDEVVFVRFATNLYILRFIFVLLLGLAGWQANAEVRLTKLISSGMVLQRDVPLKIWGWADAFEKIQIEFQGKKFDTTTGVEGNWQVEFPAMPAGGPYSLSVNEIVLNDILVGDVWLASGQSNMELQIRRVLDLYAVQSLKTGKGCQPRLLQQRSN